LAGAGRYTTAMVSAAEPHLDDMRQLLEQNRAVLRYAQCSRSA
jgi:hypothetical protein